jgi:2-methylisocitrate lyase-like PEP mutase family enzyme
MPTQIEKANALRAPHERSGTFVIPNPWDLGSARLLTALGFEALTSTSAGFTFSRGLPDYGVGRDAILTHVADLTACVDLPMAADLENGFGDDPKTVTETIRLAGATGIVGGSIEDATGRADAPIYSLEA